MNDKDYKEEIKSLYEKAKEAQAFSFALHVLQLLREIEND